MEEIAVAARFWCHMCSQMVNPIMEVEIKCPFCQSGFVEEMGNNPSDTPQDSLPDLGSDRALSLWAPILLGMMNNTRRRRRSIHQDQEQDEVENEDDYGENELDRELEFRRRRRSSATILQLLQSLRSGTESEFENLENSERNRERVILINPYNQTVIVQGSSRDSNQSLVGSLGNYFIGTGLDLLLQHLAENDPNRYGSPPAHKDAVEEMPTVRMGENLQCSVCLDDFEMGAEAKEMPCKHKFHPECIFPWLELHSSCPVCRFQMPAEESKVDSDGSRNNNRSSNRPRSDSGRNSGEHGDRAGRNGNGRRFSIPWPFSGLFSSSASQTGASSSSTGSDSHTNDS